MSELISIIIPAYNSSKYIYRMLDSVCNQTYSNLEIIIIDDGSTDDTLLLCKEYAKKDSRIRVFHKDNEGVTKARDYGIAKASGKYLAFLDSDDSIESQMYEVLYTNLKKYDADISHCGHKLIYSDDSIEYHYNTSGFIIQDQKKGIIDLLVGNKVEPGLCTKLYKRHLFDNLNYDKSMRINEDYVINLLVFAKSNKSVFIDICYYNYYMNSTSASHQKSKEYYYRDILKAADLILDMFRNDSNIYPYAERKWFKTYSDMYKNHGSYPENIMEFDRKRLLREVLKSIQREYLVLKKNTLLNKSDKFILKMIKYCPHLLVLICKLR